MLSKPGGERLYDLSYAYHRARCEVFFAAYFDGAKRFRSLLESGARAQRQCAELARLHELQRLRAGQVGRALLVGPSLNVDGSDPVLAVLAGARADFDAAVQGRDLANSKALTCGCSAAPSRPLRPSSGARRRRPREAR